MTGVFLICWVPFFTCNIMDAICLKLQWECQPGVTAFLLTTWLGYMNSFINPVIYTIFNLEFRKAFKRILICADWNQRRWHFAPPSPWPRGGRKVTPLAAGRKHLAAIVTIGFINDEKWMKHQDPHVCYLFIFDGRISFGDKSTAHFRSAWNTNSILRQTNERPHVYGIRGGGATNLLNRLFWRQTNILHLIASVTS